MAERDGRLDERALLIAAALAGFFATLAAMILQFAFFFGGLSLAKGFELARFDESIHKPNDWRAAM